MKPFLQWFIGEPGAVWIIGLLGLIVGVFYFWKERGRPPRIVIQEIRRIKLLAIHSSQREKLAVSFTDSDGVGHNIKNLIQTEFAVYNNGTSDILEPVELSLNLTKIGSDQSEEVEEEREQDLQQWSFDNPECTASPLLEEKRNNIGVLLRIPYLNSYPVHQHYQVVRSISNGECNCELKAGMGKGWSAYFISLRKIEAMQYRLRRILLGIATLITLLAMILLLSAAIQRFLGKDSLLWSENLASERIKALVQECEQNRSTVCTSYKEYLEKLASLGEVARFTYMFTPLYMIVSLLLMSISYVILFLHRKIADWMAYRLLQAQPTSKFKLEDSLS